MFDRILFPLDRSLETSHAISLVADLALKYNCETIVLSVIDPSDMNAEALAQLREQRQQLLQQAQDALRKAGLSAVKAMTTEGKVAFAICDVADDENANLIVMGCRGLGLAEDEESTNSVSMRVMQLSPCPVLMVP
ncbi:MAG: universal stress protein [Cyanobacteria bacterium P01_E01_bin.34]